MYFYAKSIDSRHYTNYTHFIKTHNYMPRLKPTPHEFLGNLIDNALHLGLVTAEEAREVLTSDAVCVQDTIDLWRKKLRAATNPSSEQRLWVLAVPVTRGGVKIFERIDEDTFESYDAATNACRRTKQLSPVKIKCRVIEFSSVVLATSSSIGRTAQDIIDILRTDGLTIDEHDVQSSLRRELPTGYLCLREKGISGHDIPGIISLCEHSGGCITQLGLTHNSLRATGTKLLSSSLQVGSPFLGHISALFLGSNDLGDDGVFAISELLESCVIPSLTKLSLNDNRVSDLGAERIAAVIHLSRIEVLGLSKNMITEIGALSLSDALSRTTHMTRLFLNNNAGIGDCGATSLAASARAHLNLKRLGLSDCGISDLGGLSLLSSLSANSNMERICVCGNKFSVAIEKAMREECRFNFLPVQS